MFFAPGMDAGTGSPTMGGIMNGMRPEVLAVPPRGVTDEAAVPVGVKVCGITCEEDAWEAVRSGVDALGFNAWKGSKRWVDVAAAAHWMGRLPAAVSRVVLFVNAPLREALEISALPVVDVVQFHGEEPPEYLAEFARECDRPVIRAVRLGEASALGSLERMGTWNVLVDAAVAGAFGGTGARVDWDLARKAVEEFPHLRILLAGGLTPENVAEAVQRVGPYAVDVASGVEGSVPGRKDPRKMAAFVAAAKCVVQR